MTKLQSIISQIQELPVTEREELNILLELNSTKTSDIFFIEALKDYVVINALNARYTIHSTMKDIEKKLPTSDFIRVHRSFIVRIDKIVAIEQPNLILEYDKKLIPIGGSFKDDLNNEFGKKIDNFDY